MDLTWISWWWWHFPRSSSDAWIPHSLRTSHHLQLLLEITPHHIPHHNHQQLQSTTCTNQHHKPMVHFNKGSSSWTLPEAAVGACWGRLLGTGDGIKVASQPACLWMWVWAWAGMSVGCWDTGPSCNPDPAGASSLGGVGWGRGRRQSRRILPSPALAACIFALTNRGCLLPFSICLPMGR